MLEISHEIVQQIAKMPTEHSWAVPLMLLPLEQADQAEAMVLDWIEEEMTDIFPKSYQAERLVRTVWLHMLEAPAIEMWIDQNPVKGINIPVIYGPSQAAMYGAMDVMYVDQSDIKAATEFLTLMQEGIIKPNVDKIMQKVLSSIINEDFYPQFNRLHGSTALIYWYGEKSLQLISTLTKFGYILLLKEIFTFSGWSRMIHYYLDHRILQKIPLTQDQVEELICDIWNYPYTTEGETHTISEWADIFKNQKN